MFQVSIPMPALTWPDEKELKKLATAVPDLSQGGPVRGGVVSVGDAAAYALVWEWGNARQTQKGPKTVLGTNPDGQQVWLSMQAPLGYIRINEHRMLEILDQMLKTVTLTGTTVEEVLLEMKQASFRAAQDIAELIRESAPVDTGALRHSILPADPNDPDLERDSPGTELGEDFQHALL